MPRMSTNSTLMVFMFWFMTASIAVSGFLFWTGAYHQSLEDMYDLLMLCLSCS